MLKEVLNQIQLQPVFELGNSTLVGVLKTVNVDGSINYNATYSTPGK